MAAIEFRGVTKVYKKSTALDEVSFEVNVGRITGLLGPNGAGKSTALKCLLGLVTPTSGSATFNGRQYVEIDNPAQEIGALLDSRSFLPHLTGRKNLLIEAAAVGVSEVRVDELLELVELSSEANKKFKAYSLGMKQRLGIATALIGNPSVLVLDEPSNGLDPIGIAWLRSFLRRFASSGKTVLISSHQLAEMEQTVDDVVILHHGKTKAQGSTEEICDGEGLENAFLRVVGAK